MTISQMERTSENGFVSLFNGRDLSGWFATPRSYGDVLKDGASSHHAEYNESAAKHPAVWTVEDGAIVGRQDSPGSGWGGYLSTERKFANFELVVEAKPDWPADTGIMLRKRAHTFHGIQVLLDYRQSGSIGGFYGNGIGGFHAVPFALDAVRDADGKVVALREDDPTTSVEPFTQSKRDMLTTAAGIRQFLEAWKFGDWNEFRIRVVGIKPKINVWINGLEVAAIDMGQTITPSYDAEAVASFLGRDGHIAFEVHDSDPNVEEGRWGREAACRWRNIRIKELGDQ